MSWTDVNGYEIIYMPNHPNSMKSGEMFLHRYIMSEHIGRPLENWEIVHHINGNSLDNNIENLQIMTVSEHNSLHNKGNQYGKGARMVRFRCPECGKIFVRPKRLTRFAKSRNSDITACSGACSAKFQHRRKTLSAEEIDKLIENNIIEEFVG